MRGMSITHIIESALGVVLGVGFVVACWLVVKATEFFWTFGKAAASLRVRLVCEKKE